MKRDLLRFAVLLAAGLTVGACGYVQNTELFDNEFWADSPLAGKNNTSAELGLAELGKGNYSVAEHHFRRALNKNPKDVHALLGMGVLYQNTGQTTKAREMYEAILAVRPDASEQFVIWNTANTRPVSEIASVNLALLQSRGVVAGVEQGAAGREGQASDVAGAPQVSAMMGRNMTQPGAANPAGAVPQSGVMSVLGQGDLNVASRFKTLAALRDEGLVTVEEYGKRRQANLGALLPLTSPPPAAGLDRPVPSTDQISGRLRAIGRALEMRAMTIKQHSSERSMIVDALMPSAPVAVANPAPPPQGLMEAADAVRRIEALQGEGLISSDEYARERAAIESSMQPKPMAAAAPAMAAPQQGEEKAMAAKGPQPAVHLASYRSRKAADNGWAQLSRSQKNLLGGFRHEIKQINLGRGKGTFYRLIAGPVASEAAAEKLCRTLKQRRQYCEPSFMNGG
ncbi:MAG: tetratricopeptide repeat protein [Alphaproteobacteria bacterium]|nr:tetratricopeptide repeat protein [Alphaproteobacteria bacterium]